METILTMLFCGFVCFVLIAGPLANVLGFVNNLYKELHK